jgi:hypothetical protein
MRYRRNGDETSTAQSVASKSTVTGIADPLVAYLGWHRRGNLGDDAIYDAVRSQLPRATFLDVPTIHAR